MPADMRVGFIGLGVMGRPMAANVLAAGYELTVHTRTASRAAAVLASGAVWAGSPGDVAATTDVTITMLPDGPDVARVARQADGLLERAKARAHLG